MRLVEIGWTRIPVHRVLAVKCENEVLMDAKLGTVKWFYVYVYVEHMNGTPFRFSTTVESEAQKVYTDALAALENYTG